MSLGSILGPEFAAAPAVLFGPDRFHPSADGYHALASVLLPSVLAALGLLPDEEVERAHRGARACCRSPTPRCEAVRHPGTELDGTEVGGDQRGLRGRWVELRHRGRQAQGQVESPERRSRPSPPRRRRRAADASQTVRRRVRRDTDASQTVSRRVRRDTTESRPVVGVRGSQVESWWTQSPRRIARIRSRLV